MPPHFPSSFLGDSIIEGTKGNGGFTVVGGVYVFNEVLLRLPYVAETVFWAPRGICKSNPKMKIEKSIPGNKNRVDVCQPTFDAIIFTS